MYQNNKIEQQTDPHKCREAEIRSITIGDDFFAIPRYYVRMLDIDIGTAYILSFLCSHAYKVFADERKQGWFYCSIKQMEEGTDFTKDQQNRCLAKLKRKQIITVDKRGIPPRRYLKIDYKIMKKYQVEIMEIYRAKQKARKPSKV